MPLKLEEVGRGGKDWLRTRLDCAHDALFKRALRYREENTRTAASYEEMKKILKE